MRDYLPPDASYQGLDISSTMVGLATGRLQAMAGRARITQTDGDVRLAFADNQFDRFTSEVLVAKKVVAQKIAVH